MWAVADAPRAFAVSLLVSCVVGNVWSPGLLTLYPLVEGCCWAGQPGLGLLVSGTYALLFSLDATPETHHWVAWDLVSFVQAVLLYSRAEFKVGIREPVGMLLLFLLTGCLVVTTHQVSLAYRALFAGATVALCSRIVAQLGARSTPWLHAHANSTFMTLGGFLMWFGGMQKQIDQEGSLRPQFAWQDDAIASEQTVAAVHVLLFATLRTVCVLGVITLEDAAKEAELGAILSCALAEGAVRWAGRHFLSPLQRDAFDVDIAGMGWMTLMRFGLWVHNFRACRLLLAGSARPVVRSLIASLLVVAWSGVRVYYAGSAMADEGRRLFGYRHEGAPGSLFAIFVCGSVVVLAAAEGQRRDLPEHVLRVMRAYGDGEWLHVVHVGWNGGLDPESGVPMGLFERALHEHAIHFVRVDYAYFVRIKEGQSADGTIVQLHLLADSINSVGTVQKRRGRSGASRSKVRIRLPAVSVTSESSTASQSLPTSGSEGMGTSDGESG